MARERTMIPMPPSHWVKERHSKILGGRASISVRTVEPVVVNPDMLSKSASTTPRSCWTYGIAPNSAATNQADATVAIAVLPFKDMSPGKDQEYLCEGMAEEVMSGLGQIAGIRVASRTSAFRAGQEGKDLPAIGRALHVGHVLEGSVRTAGDRLRVEKLEGDVGSELQLDEVLLVGGNGETRVGQPLVEPRRQRRPE